MKLPPLLALTALFAAVPLAVAAEKSAVPFRPLSFEAACAAAQTEGKLVFVDFFTTWCEPCKRLDRDTWTDAAVGKLVGENTVALKLDAEKEGRAAAQRYKVSAYPTLLLVRPDGTEIDRLVGYRDAAKFREEFAAGLAGKPALVRAAEAVVAVPAGGRDAVRARYDFGRTLAQSGKFPEALEVLLWCYDEGMLQETSFAGVRTSFLTSEIGLLAAKYPPAREALVTRRDDAKTRLLSDPKDRRAPTELSALNEALGDAAANLVVFDQLPAGDLRRRGFGLRVYNQLVSAQRYRDAVEVQPYDTMVRMLDLASNRARSGTGPAGDATKAYAIKSAASNVEALAGAGDLAHARELMAKVLALDSSDATKATLRDGLGRAKHPELLDAPPATP